jgi:YggT family protein
MDPTTSFALSFWIFLGFCLVIIIVRILLTWFPNIDWMQQIVGLLSPLTDPYLNLFRFIPPLGGIDLSPMIAIIALQVVRGAIGQFVPPEYLAQSPF